MSNWPTEVQILTEDAIVDSLFCLPDGEPGCLAGHMQRELRVVYDHAHSLQMAIDWYDTFNIVYHCLKSNSKYTQNQLRRLCYNVAWCLLGYSDGQSDEVLCTSFKIRKSGHPIPEPTTVFTSSLPRIKSPTHPETAPTGTFELTTTPVQSRPYIPKQSTRSRNPKPLQPRLIVKPALPTATPTPTPTPSPNRSVSHQPKISSPTTPVAVRRPPLPRTPLLQTAQPQPPQPLRRTQPLQTSQPPSPRRPVPLHNTTMHNSFKPPLPLRPKGTR